MPIVSNKQSLALEDKPAIEDEYLDYLAFQRGSDGFLQSLQTLADKWNCRTDTALFYRLNDEEGTRFTPPSFSRLVTGRRDPEKDERDAVARAMMKLDRPPRDNLLPKDFGEVRPYYLDYFRSAWWREPEFKKANKLRLHKVKHADFHRIAQWGRTQELEAFRTTLNAESLKDNFGSHFGQELIYVLDGSVEIEFMWVQGSRKLDKHDLAFFDSGHPHKIVAHESAELLLVMSNPYGVEAESLLKEVLLEGDEPQRKNALINKSAHRKLRFKRTPKDPVSARAIIELIGTPYWLYAAASAGLGTLSRNDQDKQEDRPGRHKKLIGESGMEREDLRKLAHALGKNVADFWRPMTIDEVVHCFKVTDCFAKDPIKLDYERQSHERAYHDRHLQNHLSIDASQWRRLAPQMIPRLLRVTSKSTCLCEAHKPGDHGLELVYPVSGSFFYACKYPGVPDPIKGSFGPGDCLIFDEALPHCFYTKGDEEAQIISVYYARGGVRASFREAPRDPASRQPDQEDQRSPVQDRSDDVPEA